MECRRCVCAVKPVPTSSAGEGRLQYVIADGTRPSRVRLRYGLLRMAAWPSRTQHKQREGSKERSMEHRWGHRLSTDIPVRLRCMQSRDSGCRCLGCLESVSASGALIRTELAIRPAPNVVVATLAPALGLQGRELPASIVRASSGEIAVEWMEFASTGVSAVMTETMLSSERGDGERPMPTLGRVRFCALASATPG